MNLDVAYQRRSTARGDTQGLSLDFATNLRRDRVSFVGELQEVIPFREAVGALHDVVIGDHRIAPKNREAYQAYLQRQQARESQLRLAVYQGTVNKLLQEQEPPRPDLVEDFHPCRRVYWEARQSYSDFLAVNDPRLFRALVPCDPVVTVADDVVTWECFSKDESSYGCLTVDRDRFREVHDVTTGTTNIDYSLNLYQEFQRLRTYRTTRFAINPEGLEVQRDAHVYREEKIDLPTSWLQGFLQLQGAMSLPMRRVSLGRSGLYSLLAYLKRHRARHSPRAIRWNLIPDAPVEIILEPWEKRIVLADRKYSGSKPETIRTWGRDRLMSLARLLPIAEDVDVYLLGTGLPSFWNVRLPGMRFLLGLSGWTANDWTHGGGSLIDLAPPVEPKAQVLEAVAMQFRQNATLRFSQLQSQTSLDAAELLAALNRYAQLGQLIRDLPGDVYRWRSILPVALSLDQVVPDSPESQAGQRLAACGAVRLHRDETVAGIRALVGQVEQRSVELLCDSDGHVTRGLCNCSHYYRFKLRAGPCRHMQALRRVADGKTPIGTIQQWYRKLSG